MKDIRYVKDVGTLLASSPGDTKGAGQMLLGARLNVDEPASVNGWVPATAIGFKNEPDRKGFVELTQLDKKQQLRIFYVDVGQGDATLIEGEKAIVIIDGGPRAPSRRISLHN